MAMRLGYWLTLLLLCPMVVASAAVSQQRDARVALVIGNANYAENRTTLFNTINDARALADEFRWANFDVDFEENLGKDKMQQAIAAFMAKINDNTTALFYFSGIGLQSVRQSYLLPVDAQIRTEENVWLNGFSVDDLLAEMNRKGAKVKIIIIDAARRNPFERHFRASPAGLAPIVAPAGTLALYSAAPGKLIKDSTSAHSPFATELVREFRSSSHTAEEVFNRARIGVSRASKNEQVPFVASSLTEEFYFSPSRIAAGTNPPAPSPPAVPDASRKPSPTNESASLTEQSRRNLTETRTEPGGGSSQKSEPGGVLHDCPDCPGLVVVPAGSFEMGSPNSDYDKPIHHVTFSRPFAIGRFEVTFKEWDKCVEERGCKHRPDDRSWGRGSRPVINVSWLDTKEYVAWLTKKTGHVYRLPSEAEWEYAARAGTGGPYWWGRSVGARLANCRGCNTGQAERSSPVGSYKPNAFHLYDTAGNVAEWVEDCWNDDYRGAPTDGSAWVKGNCQLRVLRGGSFDSDATYIQSGVRFRYDYDVPYSANGFRVVREMP